MLKVNAGPLKDAYYLEPLLEEQLFCAIGLMT